MTVGIAIYAAFALAVGVFLLGCLHLRWFSAGRAGMVGGFVALLTGAALAGAMLLGMPKPTGIEWRPMGEVRLVAWTFEQNRAIWVWVIRDGDDAPTAYELPWSTGQAQELYAAEAEASESGTGVMIDMNAQPGEPMAYPEPQAPEPPKTAG